MPRPLDEAISEYRVLGQIDRPEPARSDYGWSDRLGSSIDSYQANLYGVGEALGFDVADQRRANEAASNATRERTSQALGIPDSFKDINGVGSAARWLGGLAVDSAPYLGEAVVGGGVGGLAARGLGLATRGAVGAARTAGAVAASYPSAVGDLLSNQREQSGQMDLPSAAALGVPYAGLNAFGVEGALARNRGFRSGMEALDATTGVRGGLQRAGATAGVTALAEGSSETGQEFLNQAARNAVDPSAGYFGDEAMSRYGESFVGGAALGGVMGGGLGGWRRNENWKPTPTQEGNTDLLSRKPADAAAPAGPYTQQPNMTGFDEAFPENQYSPLSGRGAVPEQDFSQLEPLRNQKRALMGAMAEAQQRNDAPTFYKMQDALGQLAQQLDPMEEAFARSNAGVSNVGQQSLGFNEAHSSPPTNLPLQTRPALGLPLQSYVDSIVGVNREPYAGATEEERKKYPQQFEEAATARTGQQIGDMSGDQVEYNDTDIEATQRRAGILAEEQRLQNEAKAAEAKHKANRDSAVTALIDANPDGTLPIKLNPREIATHTALVDLKNQGVIDDAKFSDLVGKLREALKAADKKTLSAVAKEVKDLAPKPVAAAPATQGVAPNVSVPTSPGPATGGSGVAGTPVVEGSVAAPGPGVSTAVADPAPTQGVPGDSAQAGPVAGAAPANGSPAVATAPVVPTPPAGAKGTRTTKVGTLLDRIKGKSAVIGGSVDFNALKLILEGEDPRMHHAIRLTLGVDKDGNRLDKPLSAQAAAEVAGITAAGKKNTEVSRVSNALGIVKEVRNRWTASSAQANERADGDIGEETALKESTAEDTSPVLSDEVADTEGGEEREMADAGITAISSPGGSKGNIEAAGAGAIQSKKWYQPAVERGLDGASDKELAEIAARVTQFANKPDTKNPDALAAYRKNQGVIAEVMGAVKRRLARNRDFATLVNLAYDRIYEATPTKDSKNESTGSEAAVPELTGEIGGRTGSPEADAGSVRQDDTGDQAAEPAKPAAAPVVTTKKRRVVEKPVETKAAGPTPVTIQAEDGKTMEFPDGAKTVDLLQQKVARLEALVNCLR